jgi:hypothetical protein
LQTEPSGKPKLEAFLRSNELPKMVFNDSLVHGEDYIHEE